MAQPKYNPLKTPTSFMGIKFVGFMKGASIKVKYDEAKITTHMSNDGIMSVVLNPNFAAKATVILIQGSPTNNDLYKKLADARLNKLPSGDFSMVDLNGSTVVHSEGAMIEGTPEVVFSDGIEGREWVFILPEAEIVPGGANS